VLQFQCALPEENGREGAIALLREITAARIASPLAVLKTFGNIASPGTMSFPRPGVTLAVDFPIHGDKSFRLYDRLAELTAEFGGRMYPAKDSRMTAPQFQSFYPQWKEFSRYIDPNFSSAFWQRVAPKELLFA
jgi:FAD/FMN-containing dehydrogenase